MKPEQDREIDSLLREHVRRGRVPPFGVGPHALDAAGGAGASHLDADELSAFAENALPAASRARYVAHLADCERCRGLAAQLTISAGAADELERSASRVAPVAAVASGAAVTSVTPAASWRGWLSGLFASRALRYAMPLAALLAVSAAVLLMMTGGRRDTLGELARGGNTAQKAQPELQHAPAAQPQGAGATATRQDGLLADPSAAKDATQAASSERTEESITKAVDAAGRPAAGSQGEPLALRDAQTAPSSVPPAYAPEVATAASPTPAAASAAASRAIVSEGAAPAPPASYEAQQRAQADAKEKSREEAARLAAVGRQREHGPRRNNDQVFNNQIGNSSNRAGGDETERNSPRDADRRGERRADSAGAAPPRPERDERAEAKRAPAPRARAGVGRAAAQSEGAKTERDDSKTTRRGMTIDGAQADAATRTVAGRRFRRQGDAWIDTGYSPSRATVQIRRGSEQYRALVADEPEIGRIAGALPGEVVVVWKGRAYRIR
jgi:Putative zinc-finger